MRMLVGNWKRVGAIGWLALVERGLLVLLALQCVRLIWAILTPVGSFGPWDGRQAQIPAPAARQALFASFDPFFRDGAQPAAGNMVVTSLALTVYGIRLNEGSGLGSAIIAGPDGVQNSFAVGDEVQPGVVLKSVAFDHVTIDRGGAEEHLFLDQSAPVPDAASPERILSGTGGSAAPATIGGNAPTAEAIRTDIGFTPRTENGRITGVAVSQKGPGFSAAGFHPGDVIRQVNGQPLSDLQALQNQIMPGARLSLSVERSASIATVNLILQGQ